MTRGLVQHFSFKIILITELLLKMLHVAGQLDEEGLLSVKGDKDTHCCSTFALNISR